MKEKFDAQWHELAEDVLTGMKEWRLQHPRATFREIEKALDEQLGKVRARMLQDLVLASAAADLRAAQEQERPVCPNCGTKLESNHRCGCVEADSGTRHRGSGGSLRAGSGARSRPTRAGDTHPSRWTSQAVLERGWGFCALGGWRVG